MRQFAQKRQVDNLFKGRLIIFEESSKKILFVL
jgi:hypothetical protein